MEKIVINTEKLQKNVTKAVKNALKQLKECNYDWYANVYVYDNGATAYYLAANGVHVPQPLIKYDDAANGVLFQTFGLRKGDGLKSAINFIMAELND